MMVGAAVVGERYRDLFAMLHVADLPLETAKRAEQALKGFAISYHAHLDAGVGHEKAMGEAAAAVADGKGVTTRRRLIPGDTPYATVRRVADEMIAYCRSQRDVEGFFASLREEEAPKAPRCLPTPKPRSPPLPQDTEPVVVIGDPAIIGALEAQVDALLCYDPKSGRNAAHEAGLLESRILLQGPEGEGKNTLVTRLKQYAREHGAECLSPEVHSSYQDGRIVKFHELMGQIGRASAPVLVTIDEIDGLLKEEVRETQKRADLQIIQEFNKYLDGEHARPGKEMVIGMTNDVLGMPRSTQRRFTVYLWEGAKTAGQKAELLRAKLKTGLEQGYVRVDERDLRTLGERAVELGLSGSDLTKVCLHARMQNFDLEALHDAKGLSYDRQQERIREGFSPVGKEHLARAMEVFAGQKAQAREDAQRYRHDKAG